MRCYFSLLSIDMFVFFTRYSFRYLSLKILIFHPSNCCYCTKYMAFAFALKLSARPSKAAKGHCSLSEVI